MLAALMENKDPAEVMEKATGRFRGVSWDVLKNRRDIICGGGTLDEVGAGEAGLHLLAAHCALGDCDVFLSHSWQDTGWLKWEKLTEWCENFREEKGRAPILWLDKICIDQNNIFDDLECLPVFLSGCKGILILSGTTYMTRLWCIVELFTFFTIQEERKEGEDVGSRATFEVIPIAEDKEELGQVWQTWLLAFDARKCNCYDPKDKARIMAVIEQSTAGGVDAFNSKITYVACRVAHDHRKPEPQQRLADLEAEGVVTPNLGTSRSPSTINQPQWSRTRISRTEYAIRKAATSAAHSVTLSAIVSLIILPMWLGMQWDGCRKAQARVGDPKAYGAALMTGGG